MLSMSSRLFFAVFISLALHGISLYPGLLKSNAKPAKPVLQAELRLPPATPTPVPDKPPEETLLKNTMDSEEIKAAEPAKEPEPKTTPAPKKITRQQAVRAAQRKLSEHLLYPPQAIKEGLEGEVWLIITLGEDDQVEDVNVATSSGHAILDNAAIKAAYAMGRQAGAPSRELTVPVYFRLE